MQSVTDTSAVSSSSDINSNSSAKLKRFKIQESMINKDLLKSYSDIIATDSDSGFTSTQSINSATRVNLLFREMHESFIEISENTKSREVTDVENVKKHILLIEDKIKAVKTCIQTEMKKLKDVEGELTLQINNGKFTNLSKNTCNPKIKTYSHIVTSPVKAMINSPIRCQELKDFQDFLAIHGRHGGWIEYNDNIFKTIWQKYFEKFTEFDDIQNSIKFPTFLEEIAIKIPGVATHEIINHCQWFFKFSQLKSKQQLVLNRWKENKLIKKRIIKDNMEKVVDNACQEDSSKKNNCHKHDKNLKSNRLFLNTVSRVMEPTVQWNNRCFKNLEISAAASDTFNIDTINKLRVPQWRACLTKYDNI
ncbi:coiled-coil domain-containing protein 112-like [Plutella xylostella]|uniref:coiled-coil domain-containing protein 112-like n=1 Tax=Plutella xylostella TaxID=51655 RepID=UPI0020322B32|nr:coiled-coil domain-containing protein 112-like [Plutella xylostella]